MFISPSNDIRFLEPVLLRTDQITGYQPRGVVAGVVGLMVGFTPNCLSVISVENRLILNNGSHRASALREIGITTCRLSSNVCPGAKSSRLLLPKKYLRRRTFT